GDVPQERAPRVAAERVRTPELGEVTSELELAELVTDSLPEVVVPCGRRTEVDDGVVLLHETLATEQDRQVSVLVQHVSGHRFRESGGTDRIEPTRDVPEVEAVRKRSEPGDVAVARHQHRPLAACDCGEALVARHAITK